MTLLFQLLLDVRECDTKVGRGGRKEGRKEGREGGGEKEGERGFIGGGTESTVPPPSLQMRVLNVLSVMMDRVGSAVQPYVAALLQYMPQLWLESAEKNSSMLRCVILTTLTNVVKGLGAFSSSLHPFLLPVIQLATDVNVVGVVTRPDLYVSTHSPYVRDFVLISPLSLSTCTYRKMVWTYGELWEVSFLPERSC